MSQKWASFLSTKTICPFKRMLPARYNFRKKFIDFPDVQFLIVMHLFAKIESAVNEAETSLKMVETDRNAKISPSLLSISLFK